MHSVKVLFGGALWLAATSLVSASPINSTPTITEAKRVFGSLDGKTCAWDPKTSDAWVNSGANNMLADWLTNHNGGKQDNWLSNMDSKYHTKGATDIDCSTISSNACNAPDTSCSSWPHQPYYYFRVLAANTKALFKYAHETLQDQTITNLGNIGQMLQDFKGPVPDDSQLQRFIGNMASGAGFLSTFAGVAGQSGLGTIFGLFGSAMWILGRYTFSLSVPNYDAIEGAIDQYATNLFTGVDTYLQNLLPAMWGEGNETMIDEIFDTLTAAGLEQSADSFTYNIQKLLVSGDLMVPVEESAVASALQAAIQSMQVIVLGNVLAALRYFVVGVPYLNAEECAQTYGTQFLTGVNMSGIDSACFYICQLPPDSQMAKTIDEDTINKMQSYGMNMAGMYRNVRECNNADPNTDSQTPWISSGDDDMYAPCVFNIAFVDGSSSLDIPIAHPANTPPSWLTDKTDMWDQPRTDFCNTGDNNQYVACKTRAVEKRKREIAERELAETALIVKE